MHPNETLLNTFYQSFQKKDYQGMAACYHPDAHFHDPAFGDLKGWQINAMWRMLCENGRDLELTFRDVSANDTQGRAHWDARYTFSATKKKIFNQIDASFTFKDGKIIDHKDQFDFKKWLGMAFGTPGSIMGGVGFFQNLVRKQVKKTFQAFIEKRKLAPGDY